MNGARTDFANGKWTEKIVPLLQAGARIDLCLSRGQNVPQGRAGLFFGIRALVDSVNSVNIGLGRSQIR